MPMRAAVQDAAVRVREGAPIARSLGASKLFPPMLVHLIASGETSGELEAMLERAADNQERELDGVVNTAVGILGPMMILADGRLRFRDRHRASAADLPVESTGAVRPLAAGGLGAL